VECRAFRRFAALVLAVVWWTPSVAVPADTPAPTPEAEEVLNAFKARRARLKGCRFEWISDWQYSRFMILSDSVEGQKYMAEHPDENLDQLPRFCCRKRFVFCCAGEKVRRERSGRTPAGLGEIVEFSDVSVTNGVVSKALNNFAWARRYPTGTVYRHATSDTVMEIGTLPVRAVCMMLDGAISGIQGLPTMRVGETANPDAIILSRVTEPSGDCREYEFDRSKDCQLVRATGLKWGGKVSSNMSIDYARHETGEWLPVSWSFVSLRQDGFTRYQCDARMERAEVGLEFEDSVFEIEFPPGTMVSDYRPDAEGYKSGSKSADYILKADGSKRIVGSDERGLSYDELLKTQVEPLTAAAPRRRITFWVILGANVVFVIFLARRFLRSR
jgi:hypothetical protein